MTNRFFRYKLHYVCFWLLVGAFWFYLRYQDYSTPQKALVVTLVKLADLVLMVTIANEWLIPRLLYRKRYLAFGLLLLLMVVVSSGYKMYLIGKLIQAPGLYHWTSNLKTRIYDNVLPHFFLVIAGMAAKLLTDYNRVQKRLLEIAKEKAETELTFLKAQMNPHFLFNSLNTVYFLIDKKNTAARETLHTFSEMLRFQLYEARDEKISLDRELRYLQDYVRLQALRNDHCTVQFSTSDLRPGCTIEPLLLLPFVENAFKHLSHYSQVLQNEIHIDLATITDGILFSIRNTTEEYQCGPREGGIGLRNVRRRLELLYPGRHELTITEDKGWFGVTLILKIEATCTTSVASSLMTSPLPEKV